MFGLETIKAMNEAAENDGKLKKAREEVIKDAKEMSKCFECELGPAACPFAAFKLVFLMDSVNKLNEVEESLGLATKPDLPAKSDASQVHEGCNSAA